MLLLFDKLMSLNTNVGVQIQVTLYTFIIVPLAGSA